MGGLRIVCDRRKESSIDDLDPVFFQSLIVSRPN